MLLIVLLCISAVCTIAQEPRLGLLADSLDLPPVPSGSIVEQHAKGQSCGKGGTCCCVPIGSCANGEAQVIDPRIVNNPHEQQICKLDQEYCCPDSSSESSDGIDCGLSVPHPDNQFHGAHGQADFGEYNFIVVILNHSNGFVGAGAIVSPTTVVTADHKVYNYSAHDLKVRAREWDAGEMVEPLPHVEVDVKKIISHPKSHVRQTPLTNLKSDVAVLKLAQRLDFRNEYLGSICLPKPFTKFTGQRCWVAGWGKDAFGHEGNYQRILKEVDVPILDPRQCQERLRTTRLSENFQFDKRSFVCAGGEKGKDSCEGDGGAPLMCKVENRWYLAGLVAWGIGCARPDVPGVYVNVPTFSDWIFQNSH